MTPMLKVSAAVLIAALSAVPATTAFAAFSASMVTAAKTDAVPVTNLVPRIGKWKQDDLAALGKASSVKVYDTHSLYQAPDLTKIASAETSSAADLTKLRAAISGNADLKAWFTQNKIDINKVIAISAPAGAPAEVFTY